MKLLFSLLLVVALATVSQAASNFTTFGDFQGTNGTAITTNGGKITIDASPTTNGLATTSYVDAVASVLASISYVNSSITAAVNGLASMAFVNAAIAAATGGLVTSNDLQQAVGGLATTSALTAGLAGKQDALGFVPVRTCVVVKTNDELRAHTTILADDSELVISLEANSLYSFEFLVFTAGTPFDAGQDMQVAVGGTVGVDFARYSAYAKSAAHTNTLPVGLSSAYNDPEGDVGLMTSMGVPISPYSYNMGTKDEQFCTSIPFPQPGNAFVDTPSRLRVEGLLKTTAAGTLTLQWAQRYDVADSLNQPLHCGGFPVWADPNGNLTYGDIVFKTVVEAGSTLVVTKLQ